MRKISALLPLIVLYILFSASGCGPKVYEAPEAARITARHEVVAILPPTITIKGRPNDNQEALRQAEINDRDIFQREMFSWFLRRKQQGRITVSVLDVETTNAALINAGYYDGIARSPAQWAELLEVDAVFTSRFGLSKPMSEGAAIAVGLLLGAWGTTNETTVNISLHDRGTKEMIWNYDWVARGTAFSSPDNLIEGLMRNSSRRMPYVIR